MTTLKELSQHLGLSVTQVSRALNDHDDVSAKTKKRVKEAAKKLNYHPNIAAKRLVTGRSGIVGLVYPQMPSPADAWFFSQFVGGLSASFAKYDLQFMLHMCDGLEQELSSYNRLIRSQSIDGFIIIMPTANDPRVQLLRERKIPFVLHGQTMDEPDYPFYDIDNFAVGYDLTKYLIDAGHTEIAFINGVSGQSFVERRFSGYDTAMQEAGLSICPDYKISGDMTKDTGLLETVRLFQRHSNKPTAIIASNMRTLKGIIEVADAIGLRIPEDLSVVAHDDDLPDCPAEYFPVSVTRSKAPLVNSWDPLAEFLTRHINGATLSDVQEKASHDFIVGNSVKFLK